MSINVNKVRQYICSADQLVAEEAALMRELADLRERKSQIAREACEDPEASPEGKFGPFSLSDGRTVSAFAKEYKKTGQTSFVWRGLDTSPTSGEVIEL